MLLRQVLSFVDTVIIFHKSKNFLFLDDHGVNKNLEKLFVDTVIVDTMLRNLLSNVANFSELSAYYGANSSTISNALL